MKGPSTDEMMKEVVICKSCSSEEYYGMMYWHHGTVICRRPKPSQMK